MGETAELNSTEAKESPQYLRIVLLALYTVSLLFLIYLAVSRFINSHSDNCESWNCLFQGITGLKSEVANAYIWLLIPLQGLFYLLLIFKPKWLAGHWSFKVLATLTLLTSYLPLAFLLSIPFL